MITDTKVGELPPCLKQTVFDGRVVTLYDGDACSEHDRGPFLTRTRFVVAWGPEATYPRQPPRHTHPDGPPIAWLDYTTSAKALTDDEVEAEAAYERAQEWVRTGEMPE